MRLLCFSRPMAVLLALMPAIAGAACIKNEPDWLWNYDGTLGGKYPVRMTLVFAGGDVTGMYFYASQLKDIPLRGRITNGTNLVLDELDGAGKVVARFEGNFLEQDPGGQFGDSKLECETIRGSWRKLDTNDALPVYLQMNNGTYGTLTNRYSVAGAEDDNLIHKNALRFWNAVKSGDKRTVASLVAYPIRAGVSGRKKRIKTPEEFIANYDGIFYPSYREAVLRSLPRNMFVRDQGIMLGNGQVWFGPDGKVIALNNF